MATCPRTHRHTIKPPTAGGPCKYKINMKAYIITFYPTDARSEIFDRESSPMLRMLNCSALFLIESRPLVNKEYTVYYSIFFSVVLTSFFLAGMSIVNSFHGICSSALLITRPYPFEILSVISLEACATLVLPRECSFQILSLHVNLYIHISILISFTLIPFSCFFVVVNVSVPYH